MAEKSRVNELTFRAGAELDELELELELEVDAALAPELVLDEFELEPQAEMPTAAVRASAAMAVLLVGSCNYLLLLRSRERTSTRQCAAARGCHSDKRV